MKRTTFINKYASSGNVAHSTYEERRLINERNREHRKPHSAKKDLQRKLRHDTFGTQCSVDALSTGSNVETTFVESLTVHTVTDAWSESDLPPSESVMPSTSSPCESTALQIYGQPGNSVDPFHANAVAISETVMQLLHFYESFYYNHLWDQVSLAFDRNLAAYDIHRSAPQQVIFECMKNRARINTLLANLGCQLKYRQRASTHINTDELVLKAIEAFREEFRRKSRVDGGAVVDALHLYLAVSATDQSEAANAHLKGIRAVIQQIIDQGGHIWRTQAALVALVDINLAKRLLLDPARVRHKPGKLLGPTDANYHGSKGWVCGCQRTDNSSGST